MAKYTYPLLLLVILSFSSCQTIEELSIDYMLPAEIFFPAELKRVAIVNNTSATPDNNMIATDNSKKANQVSQSIAYHDGDATKTTQSLAEAIAHENYFEEVVICDSALRAKDILLRENQLSKQEVNELTEGLGVDFIISLENLQLKATRLIAYLPGWNCYQGTIDVKAYPTVKVYLPNRNGPMVTINAKDSIFWEEIGSTETHVLTQLPPDAKTLNEASEFAGTIPMKYLLPYWTTGRRSYYTGGSVEMRDAAIFVREKSWDKAFKLWEKVYQSTKSKKTQMCTALNIALYYEMKDSIMKADEWAIKAQTLARKVDEVDEKTEKKITAENIPNFRMITLYLAELKERKEGFMKLNTQMSRFNNEF